MNANESLIGPFIWFWD